MDIKVKAGLVSINGGAERSLPEEFRTLSHGDADYLVNLLTAAAADGSIGEIGEHDIGYATQVISHTFLGPDKDPRMARFAKLAAAIRQYGTEEQEDAMHRWTPDFYFAVRTPEETGGPIILLTSPQIKDRSVFVDYPFIDRTEPASPRVLLNQFVNRTLPISDLVQAVTALHGAFQEMAVRPCRNDGIIRQLTSFEQTLSAWGFSFRRLAPEQITTRNPRHVAACG